MTNELHDYDVFPKVFRVGKPVTVTVKPLGDHAAFKKPEQTVLYILGLEDGKARDYPARGNDKTCPFVMQPDGSLTFTYTFPKEQMYFLRFNDFELHRRIVQLPVYAVDDDLCDRWPLIGDLHMHTCRSDGHQCPAVVCADYRRHGYDFFAITDHNRYYPSLEAIEQFRDVPIEFTIVPGEEVHMPRVGDGVNDVHIVNFGGKYSVNALVEGVQTEEVGKDEKFRAYQGAPCPPVRTQEEFYQEICAFAETLEIPAGIEKYAYACCVWEFEQIRAAGGLGIFAHPYWISDVYQVPESFTDYMLQSHPFDAFEVLGGESYYEQNGFQTQKYYQMRARGYDFPIVGSTDSHSCFNNENAYVASTMVFAKKNEREALISAVKEQYTVAIDGVSAEFRLVGDLRLSKYACFLLKEFFPLHDELCYEEGRAMKDYACGVEGGRETLEFLSGRMQKQREKYFSF
ncbi:MAG: hypothetical protein IJK64_10580 [Clostridia bacterium]|nr:hypothetical protein [Clostridia bacterium]